MNDWQIVLLHTKQTTLLKRAFEAAFPGRVVSLHVPGLRLDGPKMYCRPEEVLSYFRRQVYDSGVWSNRVLTVYGDGEFHHYTYALTRLAAERRGLEDPNRPWTYFQIDNHRDDWGERGSDGTAGFVDCGSFVDTIVDHHGAVPFFVGPDAYAAKDSRGYHIRGKKVPIYSNYFTQALQKSRDWKNIRGNPGRALGIEFTGAEIPSTSDLRETPTDAYLTFDLDVLARSEIVTNFDQNDYMTLRRLCQILDRIRPHKRVFSADILGFPDWNKHHVLSCLTILILARKVMGLGVERLLEYHKQAKAHQSLRFQHDYSLELDDNTRPSPIKEGELMEVLSCTATF